MRIRLGDLLAGLVGVAAVAYLLLTPPVAPVDGVSDHPAATSSAVTR